MTTPPDAEQPVTPDPRPASNPLLNRGFLVGLVGSVITLLVAFGIHITDEQRGAIVGVATFLGPCIAALWGNRAVVEYLDGRLIRRGHANEGPTGEPVRRLGSMPSHTLYTSGDRP